MKLPTEKCKPQYDITQERILLYGDPKIGKTTLASHLHPEALIIAAEEGYRKLNAFVQPIKNWGEYIETVNALKSNKDKFPVVVIDTITVLYDMYVKHFCGKNSVDHENDAFGGYGKGVAILLRGFIDNFREINKELGRGYILIAHAQFIDDDGKQLTRPLLPQDKNDKIREAIEAEVDYIWYLNKGVVDGKTGVRQLHTQQGTKFIAGGRGEMASPIGLINGDPAKSAIRIKNAYKQQTIKPKETK